MSFSGEPSQDWPAIRTSTVGSRFIDANSAGKHAYGGFGFSENAGMAYTCRVATIRHGPFKNSRATTPNIFLKKRILACSTGDKKSFTIPT